MQQVTDYSLSVIQQRFTLGTGSNNAIFNYLRRLTGFTRTLVTSNISLNDLKILASVGIKTRLIELHDSIGFPLCVLVKGAVRDSDIIDVNLSSLPLLDFPVYKTREPSRILYTLHGGIDRIELTSSSRPINDSFFGVLCGFQRRLVARSIGGFIAISEYMWKEIRRLYNPKNIFHIPNAIDVDFFYPRNRNIDIKDPSILFVGGLYPRKGAHVLVNEMPRIIKKYPRARLTIVGDGPLRERLTSFAQRCGVGDRVKILSNLSFEGLREAYWACNIFLTASYWESFCLPVYEALATGMPAVTRNCSALSELVANKDSGVLGFSSEEEIVDRISDCLHNYKELSRASRKFAENFAPSKVAEMRRICYLRLLDNV